MERYTLRKTSHLCLGEHLCFLFDTELEHQQMITTFLAQGLKHNEKVLYLVDAHTREDIVAYLNGIDEAPEKQINSGRITIVNAKSLLLRNGAFNPDDALALLWTETQRALADGYKGLRVSIEMSWAVGQAVGIDRIFEFESKVNTFIENSWCQLLCQFDQRLFRPMDILEALATHPTILVNGKVLENFYYVPPARVIGQESLDDTLKYRLQSLIGRQEAEESMRERERRYRRIFENSLEGIFQTSVDGRYLNANPALARMYGYETPQELIEEVNDIGRQLYLDPERRLKFLELMKKQDTLLNFESLVYRKDGSLLWISENVRVIKNEKTGEKYFEGTVHDITERKRQARRVAAQQSATRALAGAASLGEASPRVLQCICEGLEWQLGAIWAVDSEVLRCVELWHVPGIEVSEFIEITRRTTFKSGVGLPGRVWSSREPAWIADVVRDTNFPRAPFAARAGLHGAFAFPILDRNDVVGVIECFTREIQAPDEDLLKMMSTIGTQIGQFILRKRIERELELTREHLREVQQRTGIVLQEAVPKTE